MWRSTQCKPLAEQRPEASPGGKRGRLRVIPHPGASPLSRARSVSPEFGPWPRQYLAAVSLEEVHLRVASLVEDGVRVVVEVERRAVVGVRAGPVQREAHLCPTDRVP